MKQVIWTIEYETSNGKRAKRRFACASDAAAFYDRMEVCGTSEMRIVESREITKAELLDAAWKEL